MSDTSVCGSCFGRYYKVISVRQCGKYPPYQVCVTAFRRVCGTLDMREESKEKDSEEAEEAVEKDSEEAVEKDSEEAEEAVEKDSEEKESEWESAHLIETSYAMFPLPPFRKC